MSKCRLSESLLGYLKDKSGVKALVKVVHVKCPVLPIALYKAALPLPSLIYLSAQ